MSIKYRTEVDGLRAVAIIPVILFHAGISLFSGGYVGVDVFFVISGYLITSIILAELAGEGFSLLNFYERRARRILPALFVVMLASSVFAYCWMLPDELENFGQSVVATTLYANNMLLALTAGYWDLKSEFKPLLHTWSLAVEEQYYIVFPLLLMLGWRYFRRHIVVVLVLLALASFALAQWGTSHAPDATFYTLPTRAWEMLIGSFAAFYFRAYPAGPTVAFPVRQAASLLGLTLILASIFGYDSHTPFPSVYTLAPTMGAVLIILFAQEGTWVHAALSTRPMVRVGWISYSAYLWHFPLFAFARVYSVSHPPVSLLLGLCVLCVLLAYLSWKFVETPLRDRRRFDRNFIFGATLVFSVLFVGWGVLLHRSHGLPSRMYAESKVSTNDMYIAYNEEVFKLKRDTFQYPQRLKVLVHGNSFGRDFVNITKATFDLTDIDIVYRDDFPLCLDAVPANPLAQLYAQADVVVYASGNYKRECIAPNIAMASKDGKRLFYVGTKHFGFNLNWLMRVPEQERINRFNPLLKETIELESRNVASIPADHYISLLGPVVRDGQTPITDQEGRLLTADRTHLTRQGAMFFGQHAVRDSTYGALLTARRP